ncbi:MBL fold metallo-hydrolase [Tepiditoga spiralis]|uniref:MBL fold metallo-hydrolase n=1 Tax=Tepiditoga spiralis TaxID=2108365 RepID=A0A7G1G7J2_9BACT|nr:MBL fold metallo-hydrolase [Tepiditoga spiralis]BBE31326.1 MBL fold metallo-hydrolase [Tepiditoga spiralis]
MNFTILCNDEKNEDFFSEHGFSILIEKDNKKLLFDTGHTDVYMKNAKKLNLDLNEVDAIVLSHGHYDHAGGINYLLKEESKFKVYIHEKTMQKKYSKDIFKGIDFTKLSNYKNLIKIKNKKMQIIKDIYVFGPVEMKNDFEEPSKDFFVIEKNKKIRDFFEDELNIVIDTNEGLILITGCAHRGIVNIATDTIKEFKKDIKLIIGGFHLKDADSTKINKVIEELNKLNIKSIMPCHCTGNRALKLFEKKFNNEVKKCNTTIIPKKDV